MPSRQTPGSISTPARSKSRSEDGSFDGVPSCLGATLAPDEEAVGRELGGVCRPGVRLGLTAWCVSDALDLPAEPIQSSSFDRAVISFRARQSSGYRFFLIRLPSSSTGVPCVPTTSSPMIRETTL
jgi:hypothetical protein